MNKCRDTICYLLRKKKKKEPVTHGIFLLLLLLAPILDCMREAGELLVRSNRQLLANRVLENVKEKPHNSAPVQF